jgi:hypothetical protein
MISLFLAHGRYSPPDSRDPAGWTAFLYKVVSCRGLINLARAGGWAENVEFWLSLRNVLRERLMPFNLREAE